MNTHDMIELPPLRTPDLEDELTAVLCAAISWGGSVISSEEYVAAKQRFRAAVNAAIEADRQRKGEVVVTKTPEGEIVAVTRQDDEGRILSVIAEADRKRRGEQRIIGKIVLDGNRHPRAELATGYDEHGDQWKEGTPIYAAPQPAEPVRGESVAESTCEKCGHAWHLHMNTVGCCQPIAKFPDTENFKGGIDRCYCEELPRQPAEPGGYVHTAPDDCETLHWRGQILSLNELATISAEPVAWLVRDAMFAEWLFKWVEPEPGLWKYVKPLYAAPQPAEPVKRKRRYAQGTALGEFGIIPMCDQVDDEPVKVPDSYRIVPSTITEDMDDALRDYLRDENLHPDSVGEIDVGQLWSVLLEAAPQPAESVDPDFMADLKRSRAKYPGNARMFDGLMGELDELRRAYAGDGDIRAEAFDVAVCAYRIATEGDAGENTLLKPAEPVAKPVSVTQKWQDGDDSNMVSRVAEPVKGTPIQERIAKMEQDPKKKAALDRARERLRAGEIRVEIEPFYVEQSAEPVKVPSDDIDIEDVRQYLDSWGCLAHPGVRALLDRYGKGTP